MKLKHSFPLFFSFLFSLLLAAVLLTVFYLFANFRQADFKERLSKKAETTVKLLLEVKEIDEKLLKIIDHNSINKLYNEKTLIFNDSIRLIYSSIDDATIDYSTEELNTIKKRIEVFKKDREYDVLGRYYKYNGSGYYVLISAEDKYGNRNLNHLRILLMGAFLFSTALVWFISFYLSRKALLPLDRLSRQMQLITSKNLTIRVHEPKRKDEIKALSRSFNQMLDRIDKAYNSQKEFSSNASHELRTPITRIVTQLENIMFVKGLAPEVRETLKSISEDAYLLSDIITSLLLLSKVEEFPDNKSFQKVRLDEIIFHAASRIYKTHPDFKLYFEIENYTANDLMVETDGDETLLSIAFLNLFKNAYDYSDNQSVQCILKQYPDALRLFISNTGETPNTQDTKLLFNTFTRGSNIKNKTGSGVGLRIVQRILHYHGATIVYNIPDTHINQLILSFPLGERLSSP
ncbi:MAG: HAMP domain-containing protein [Flavisolibacter sp.]|nr:HAMP domain-containing protein [Flavisolibacter sp.]